MSLFKPGITGSFSQNKWPGYSIVGAVFLLFMIAEMVNGRFWLSDFEVYYRAASRILAGQNLYRIEADGFYLFKYSPVSAILFIPFAFLPFAAAKIIYWLLYSLVMLACIDAAIKIVFSKGRREDHPVANTMILLAGLIFAVHFLRELHLGQVTFILLLLYLLSVRSMRAHNPLLTGFLLSVSLFIKPFGLIFLPWLLVRGRWKDMLSILLFTLVLAALPLFFYRSFGMVSDQYAGWYREVFIELGNKQDLSLAANQTIFSVVARYSGLSGLLATPALFIGYQILILSLLAGWVIFFMMQGKSFTGSAWPEWFFLMGLIPLLAFSGENSFCLLLPAAVLILYVFRDLSVLLKIVAIISFLLIGGNIYDIWGPALSAYFDQISLITLGATGLLVIMSIMRFRKVF